MTSNLLKTAKLRRNGAGEEISPEVKAVVRLITRSTVSVAAREVPEAPKSVEASESAREGGGWSCECQRGIFHSLKKRRNKKMCLLRRYGPAEAVCRVAVRSHMEAVG